LVYSSTRYQHGRDGEEKVKEEVTEMVQTTYEGDSKISSRIRLSCAITQRMFKCNP
jgi:hypothetical protein